MAEIAATADRCPLCEDRRLRRRFDFGFWSVIECARCGLGFSDPMPTESEIHEIYGEPYFVGGYAAEQNYVTAGDPRRLWEVLLGQLEPLVPERSVLDVGSGLGFFLRAARDRGWRTGGIEYSEWAADFSRTHLGIETVAGEISRVTDSYGLVTMWSSLEHMLDPLVTLKHARTLLRPGGVICVGVPNLGSIDVLAHGRRAFCFKREHTFYFTRASLRRMLVSAGFIEVTPVVFRGGFDRPFVYESAQMAARWLGLSSQLTMRARTPAARDLPAG